MLNRYGKSNCPKEFPVRTKCIALFQKIHGVDSLLFAMYVYEYGHECPAPNRRRVYISYLDSAQYFSPKYFRTTAYHAILIEYLRYVKQRGFHTAHISSCPPTPGDDYIFSCHPKHQLVPREDMLRSWYHKMLDRMREQPVAAFHHLLRDQREARLVGGPRIAQAQPRAEDQQREQPEQPGLAAGFEVIGAIHRRGRVTPSSTAHRRSRPCRSSPGRRWWPKPVSRP